MRKNIDKKIQDTMEALNADGYIEGEAWNGYSVYIPQYEGSPTIGLPYVVFVKGDEVRISTEDESLAYLDFCMKRMKEENA